MAWRAAWLAMIGATMLSVSSCEHGPIATVSAIDAQHRIDAQVRRAVAKVGPGLTLPQPKVNVGNQDCWYGWQGGDGPTGEVEVSLDYVVDGVSLAMKGRVVEAMSTIGHTIVHGDYILTNPEPDVQGTGLFQVTTSYQDDNELVIHAESACIWPNGTPNPRPRL